MSNPGAQAKDPRERRANSGPRPQPVAWKRPEGEAPNTRVPMTAPLVQYGVLPAAFQQYTISKQGTYDVAKSRELGRDVYAVPGYRTMAALTGCTARTAINRRNRLAAARICSFIERFDEHGTLAGLFMIDNEWKAVIADWQMDPQIAKTADTGQAITRNFRLISPGQAATCQIKHVAQVTRRGSAPPPPTPITDGLPDASAISAVLKRYCLPSTSEELDAGARMLLGEARVQCEDITPAELADALDVELAKRRKWKTKAGQQLEIIPPYIKTFIKGVAGVWVGRREERRKEAARMAETAVRQAQWNEHQTARFEYENFTRGAMDAFIASLPESEYAALLAEATRDLSPLWPRMTKPQVAELARVEVRRTLTRRATIPSFDEWQQSRAEPARSRGAG